MAKRSAKIQQAAWLTKARPAQGRPISALFWSGGKDSFLAYRALQRFTAHCRSSRFLCKTPFAEGDLVLFDNRRMLHGRDSFDPQSGTRRLEGCYLDRDEILSRLRVLARRSRAS